MDRFVTSLASLSLMVLAFIASVQASVMPGANTDIGVEGFDGGDFGTGGNSDFF